MGYTTDFTGSFSFDRPLLKEHADYLRAFSKTRRMKRDADIASLFSDPLRIAADLPIGPDAGYFVGADGFHGQDHDSSILDYNTPPGHLTHHTLSDFTKIWDANNQLVKEGKAQPGLWCQWTVSDDNNRLEWNGGEKFYNYQEWLKYLIDNFLNRWGYKINGRVEWQGEEDDDKGVLVVVDNLLSIE